MRVDVVIPVRAGESVPETLEIALTSAKRFAPWLHPVLVGSPHQLEHMARQFEAGIVPFRQQSPNDPIGNTDRMMRAACTHSQVSKLFVWSNDDIYWLGPTPSMTDIMREAGVAIGHLNEAVQRGMYGRRHLKTAQVLAKMRRPQWNYESHVPLPVRKEVMERVTRVEGIDKRSLYQNLHLKAPLSIEPDVKVHEVGELDGMTFGSFISTGSNVTPEQVRGILEELQDA